MCSGLRWKRSPGTSIPGPPRVCGWAREFAGTAIGIETAASASERTNRVPCPSLRAPPMLTRHCRRPAPASRSAPCAPEGSTLDSRWSTAAQLDDERHVVRKRHDMASTGRLDGKVALVTGAATGLGRAAAIRMAEQGARVVVTDILDEAGDDVASEIGAPARFERLDVTRPEDWSRAMEATLEVFGRLDVLVNNAGVVVLGDVESLSLAAWRHVHAVNLDGVFLGCRHGVEVMKRGGGSIINLSSVSGLVGGHNLAAYNSSKGGCPLADQNPSRSTVRGQATAFAATRFIPPSSRRLWCGR